MTFKSYLKRNIVKAIRLISPQEKVTANIMELSSNEMLKGRTALITGGTSGIGYEMAKAFVKSGASVVITGRNKRKTALVAEQLEKELSVSKRVYPLAMDNTKVSEFGNKFEEAVNMTASKQIDILVNNAGLVGGEISTCTEEQYDAIVDTNLKGTFFLSQHVAHYFVANKIQGNIGSSSSLRPATSAYTMTKWGVYGLTKGLAKILAPHGITVNGLAPGPTATPMLMPNGINEDISFSNPLGRFEMPCEIANMAVFLVSDMGKAVVGDMVFMTGGSGVVTYDDVNYRF